MPVEHAKVNHVNRAARRTAHPEEPIPRGDGGADCGGLAAVEAHGRWSPNGRECQCPAYTLLPRLNLFRRLTKGTFGEGVTLPSDKTFFQLCQQDIVRGQQPVAFAKSGRTAISCGKVAASCASKFHVGARARSTRWRRLRQRSDIGGNVGSEPPRLLATKFCQGRWGNNSRGALNV